MKYRAYPKYKDSGVEWLGEVPEHWGFSALKWMARTKSGDFIPANEVVTESSPENFIPVIGGNGLLGYTDRSNIRKPVIAIGRVGALCGNVHEITAPSWITDNALIIDILSESYDIRYLSNVLTSRNLNEIADKTAQPLITGTRVRSEIVPFPPISEQESITNFLTRETNKIDTLLAKKRALIEKLKEKRTALISRTVTRGLPPEAARAAGLDPHPKLKPSGVEWLGDVPEHWEVKRLSYMALLKSGENITSEQIEDTGEFPVYGGNGLRGYYSDFTHNGEYALIGRQGALCGNINYATGKFWASEHAVVVNPLLPFVTKWLGEVLRAMNLNQYSVSAAQPGLSVSAISALKVSVPPFEEQQEMALFFERETYKIDQLIAKVEAVIKRLQEYRTALITAAVTGKIDVRGTAQ